MATTKELRAMAHTMPASTLRLHIKWSRETMRTPPREARNGYLAHIPNVTLCARTVAVFRAEFDRRAVAQ